MEAIITSLREEIRIFKLLVELLEHDPTNEVGKIALKTEIIKTKKHLQVFLEAEKLKAGQRLEESKKKDLEMKECIEKLRK